jgi:hypothetical protein
MRNVNFPSFFPQERDILILAKIEFYLLQRKRKGKEDNNKRGVFESKFRVIRPTFFWWVPYYFFRFYFSKIYLNFLFKKLFYKFHLFLICSTFLLLFSVTKEPPAYRLKHAFSNIFFRIICHPHEYTWPDLLYYVMGNIASRLVTATGRSMTVIFYRRMSFSCSTSNESNLI